MKNIIYTICCFLVVAVIPAFGNVDIGVIEDPNDTQGLIIQYTPLEAYNTAPRNIWNSQLFTIRWPDALGENIVTTVGSPGPFGFSQDGVTEDGEDGWYYAKFTSSADNIVADFEMGVTVDVMTITFVGGVDRCMVELVTTPNGWIDMNTGRASVNNAVAGELFNSFDPASCEVVDVEDVTENFTISLYPSPADEEAYLDLATDKAGAGKLTVYDEAGRVIIQDDKEWSAGETSFSIDVDHLAAGVYLVRLGDEFDGWTGELIVIK